VLKRGGEENFGVEENEIMLLVIREVGVVVKELRRPLNRTMSPVCLSLPPFRTGRRRCLLTDVKKSRQPLSSRTVIRQRYACKPSKKFFDKNALMPPRTTTASPSSTTSPSSPEPSLKTISQPNRKPNSALRPHPKSQSSNTSENQRP